ncbi:helix-turn-helix domain-containing protein [Pediococcus acidilactici]|uniref:AraC family transcriptional regulator n=1 Tax=Pediococcus acidilactici TaxID=1254 RepID=UPI0013276F89|nr:AraC family transcriptional regulator [Pediococcus acidilactici]KAF0334481.1 helix-turn-helix domain-containing protein [Pediococcus acidilactici]KAF0347821.1 helix-turn-helix domain-containing protein [Pediococcus acidilactici]KAF0393886.1 helix-turn-helix domain-containing protein [Pediococcus acidilactici]KAF0398109.1 helix-turn-helix domain-containing protein [Pediococcus acidilactici]KAF0410265.1 helix-turn-helix domain-containing protein [Pediococcus acidilactici]
MEKFIPIPVVDASLYVFGGHMRTVPGGWSFFEQKHQAFELMCVIDGYQTTEINQSVSYSYGPGDVIIIAPGTLHKNWNANQFNDLTYITFHFSFENIRLESEIIRNLANTVIYAKSKLAQESLKTAKEIVRYSELGKQGDLNKDEVNIKIQLIMLNYLYDLSKFIESHPGHCSNRFSEREAEVARQIAILIENNIGNPEKFNTFQDICNEIKISDGYGYRTFKKVYGMTPLHYVEKQRYRKAKLLLSYLDYSVEDVAEMVGVTNSSMFSKSFKKWSGQTPRDYRKQLGKKRIVRSLKDSGYFE